VKIPTFPEPKAPETAQVYFYDVPGAKQSVIKIGAPALAATHPDYYSAEVMNYRLGGGGFASQLTQELREGKGYTYGIRSGFTGNKLVGPFSVTSGVRSNITYEAVELIKEIMTNYPESFQPNDLEVTQGFMIKSNARKFETLGAKLGMLSDISNYELPHDFIKQREATVNNFTVEDLQALATKYIEPGRMIYLIVGDAETQLEKLENLGFGKPVLLNQK
ncbi:MAG TPA: insulinase family protein, partial [Gillisia sp.]|nr:insulinase family protein [Gillisia sp.]